MVGGTWYSDNRHSDMDRSVLKRQIFFFLMAMIVNNCSSLNVTSDNFDEEFERVIFNRIEIPVKF